jgi:arsenite oxidase small subunit
MSGQIKRGGGMRRRRFMTACAGCAAFGAAQALRAAELRARYYSRTRLVDQRGQALRAANITASNNYIFHYPFEGTPCFLIRLGEPTYERVNLRSGDGSVYQWPGGVGPERSIVAYSAICTHRMTYPTPQISFISYRAQSTASAAARQKTIHCCSEHSDYDPAAGARVVNGPAPQPLLAILLEYDPTSDGLYATGTLGEDIYSAFFAKYELKLELDYGRGRARRHVTSSSIVTELSTFSKQQVRC